MAESGTARHRGCALRSSVCLPPDRFNRKFTEFLRVFPRRGVITTRFTFHDLRAYYVMQYKERRGEVPDLHASPTTTARVYERSRVSRRDALSRPRIPTVGILGAIKTKGLAPHDANPLIWLVGPE